MHNGARRVLIAFRKESGNPMLCIYCTSAVDESNILQRGRSIYFSPKNIKDIHGMSSSCLLFPQYK